MFIIWAHPNLWVSIQFLFKKKQMNTKVHTPILQKRFFLYSPKQVICLKKEELVLFISCPLCFMIQLIFITSLNIDLKLWSTGCRETIFPIQTTQWDLFDIWTWGTTIRLCIQKVILVTEAVLKTDFGYDKNCKI